MANLTFSNNTAVSIDNATTARTISVYGAVGHQVVDVSVGLTDFSSDFISDLDLLLVAPDNQSNLVVLSDARGSDNAVLADITLTDGSVVALAGSSVSADLFNGAYRPMDYTGSTETGANFGLTGLALRSSLGLGTDFSAFDGLNPDGTWTFYVRDDSGVDTTDIGGLSLTVVTDSSSVALTGGSGADLFLIIRTSETSGVFQMTGQDSAGYGDVYKFELSGGAGVDTVSFSASAIAVLADLSDTAGTNGFAFSGIEVVTGTSHDDTLIGDDQANTLNGGDGNDILFGQGAGDHLDGGNGLRDVVTYELEQEFAIINLSVPAFMFDGVAVGDSYSGIEDVIGTLYDDAILADYQNNILSGLDGADYLAGREGDDTLHGGEGNDTLAGDLGRDLLDGGAGLDLANYESAYAGVGVSLLSSALNRGEAAGDQYVSIEGLQGSTFDDTLFGDAGDNYISGETGSDLINGASGNDTVDGDAGRDTIEGGGGDDILNGGADGDFIYGGSGNDTLTDTDGANTLNGGSGDDSYYISAGANSLSDTGGFDWVFSAANHTLGVGFENLTLQSGGAVSATGNAQANRITGNSGNNSLNGGGGVDTLIGGAGNDTFVTDGGDTVVEAVGQGTDQINSSAHVAALAANVENLLLTGAAAINGTGNGMANRITGNSGANVLNGVTGIDTLIGGSGNDTLVADGGDTVIEAVGQGTDQINSSVSVAALATNVERLLLIGAAAIDGTGNTLANQITGNAAANKLSGEVGLDTLSGGAGQDSFVFNSALVAGNVDRITDFAVVDDSILLENAVFTGLAAGKLGAAAFAKNLTGTATDGSDRIIYETDTGKLFFDADGTGGGARLHFATLATNLALTQADFTVI